MDFSAVFAVLLSGNVLLTMCQLIKYVLCGFAKRTSLFGPIGVDTMVSRVSSVPRLMAVKPADLCW